MSLSDVQHVASKCSHFAMCKIDFLDTGICHSVKDKPYVAYFPQGRMEITNALNKGLIPVTKALVDITESCDLCGICDKQCYFINELRAFDVAKELKQHVEKHLEKGKPVLVPEEDEVYKKLKDIVGEKRVSNDPAILVSYSRDCSPFSERNIPQYVVLVKSADEVSDIIKIANEYNIPAHPRASGSSSGLALGKGIIMDFYLMKKIKVEPDKMQVIVEPGVTGYELQKEVIKTGYKINVGETSACVCSNIITSRLNSLYSHSYGNGIDLVLDGNFVDDMGNKYTLSEDPLSLKDFNPQGIDAPPLCTELTLKIFPNFEDEAALLIPFHDFSESLEMIKELAIKRIGIAVGLISSESAALFTSPTKKTENELTVVLKEKLGINYLVLVIGETYALDAVKKMSPLSIDQDMFRNIIYSIPTLYEHDGIELLSELPSNKHPYEVLFKRGMENLVEVSLDPQLENYYKAVEEDMQPFYKKLFSNDNITDLLWLNLFRLTTPRLGRAKQYSPVILHLSIDEIHMIPELSKELDKIGKKHDLPCYFSNLSPLYNGSWALFEYDFFHDQTKEDERERAREAINESYELMLDYLSSEKIKNGFLTMVTRWQGLSRFESIVNSI